jgi:hypothetical protein
VRHILVRCRINRLSSVDRATADLVHADMKKLGNIPDGGGWRFLDRHQGRRNRAATPNKPRNPYRNPEMGTAYVHTVLDDHSRVAYSEFCDDVTAVTAVTALAVLRRAVAWFAARDVTIRRVLTDNGSAYLLAPLARHMHRARDRPQPDPALPARTNGNLRAHRTSAGQRDAGGGVGRARSSSTSRATARARPERGLVHGRRSWLFFTRAAGGPRRACGTA